jgi:excisionase family DNA binding protein
VDPHISTNFLNKEVNDVSATTENTSKVKLELPDDLKQAILEIVKDAAVQVVGSATRRDEQTWPEYMNKQQAAKYLNISVNTLHWIADGDIPFVVVGKMVRLNRHQLDACMLKKTLH